MIWAGLATGTGDRRGIYGVLVGTPEGKRPIGRRRRRWGRIIVIQIFRK
jgi:hypothetical protein